jgi:N-methylhydantoinase B
MTSDRARLQVFADHTRAIVEQVATTLQRTAYSSFVKEIRDFTCGLTTPEGKSIVAAKTSVWFAGLDYGKVIAAIPEYEEGDIGITNDPFSGFVCTHSPDTHVWKPVFYEGQLICFVVSHVHNTDIGGAVPASLSRNLTEIHQEGIRFPPLKLMSKGEINRQFLEVFQLNVRAPEQNWGDMKAQIAGVNTGAQKVLELVRKFGVEEFKRGIENLIDYAEEQARMLIRSLPDGEYSFHDYIDEDSENGPPCRLAVDMTIKGDEIVLDFSRSDPQLASAINMPTGGYERHTLLAIGLYYIFTTLRPGILLNAGTLKPIRCIVPEGSVLNPKFPAAVGMRTMSALRLTDVLFGAFVQAVPDLPAASAGSNVILNIRTYDPRVGRPVMAALNPLLGGGGGKSFADGQNGSGGGGAALKNTPVEINEIEVPIRIKKYQLVPDSGGAGRFRGGTGVSFEFEVQSPQTVINARNRDRTKFSAWGVYGGRAGGSSSFMVRTRSGALRNLANTDVATVEPGDVVCSSSPGGGGFGHPFERPAHMVLRDVDLGFVSVAAAADIYGVIIEDNRIDEDATAARRAELAKPAAADAGIFNFGVQRDSFEKIWPRENYDALIRFLMSLPVEWRFFMKQRVIREVGERRLSMEEVNDICRSCLAAAPL